MQGGAGRGPNRSENFPGEDGGPGGLGLTLHSRRGLRGAVGTGVGEAELRGADGGPGHTDTSSFSGYRPPAPPPLPTPHCPCP